MDGEVASSYELFVDDKCEGCCIECGTDNDSYEVAQKEGSKCYQFFSSLTPVIGASFQLSVICGIMTGLCLTLLWWIELNARGYCKENWHSAPTVPRRLRLLVESLEAIIIMMWPLLTIATISSWSIIREANIPFWCTMAGLADVIDRFYLYVFGHYDAHWQSLVGTAIFLVLSFAVFYKFVSYRQHLSNNDRSTTLITLKLLLQIIVGLIIALPYNYLFLSFYQMSSTLSRIMLSCSIIPAVFLPKMIISHVITSIHGIFDPNEGIIFAAAFLVVTTMVTRLTQAEVESLPYFTIISVVHGVLTVVDKATLTFRRKMINVICKRSIDEMNENWIYRQQYIVHQSLISIITETSSVIMSNAAAYIIIYYYETDGNTGKRYSGWYLFKEMLVRSSIAVFIEWVFNTIALKVQCDLKFPVLDVWKSGWKLIVVIHLLQALYVIVYFAQYVDTMLLDDILSNSTAICISPFKRL